MKPWLGVISCERPSMLKCCLASICNLNPPFCHEPMFVKPGNAEKPTLTVFDDASQDVAVAGVLGEYQRAGLIERFTGEKREGVGPMRRRMAEAFLKSDADLMIQIEGDVVVGAGGIAMLVKVAEECEAQGIDFGRLCAWGFPQFHRSRGREALPSGAAIEWWESQGEALWCAARATVQKHLALLTPRQDMVEFSRAAGVCSVISPEIPAQHLGCIGKSFYYPKEKFGWATWDQLCYRNEDHSVRQPFGDAAPINFPEFETRYPLCYTELCAKIEAMK
jgi:hypothetical protein